jgi:hypothetical protein
VTDAAGLWADAYQQVILRAAHELTGALNGVALNLEVIRSRADASKGDAKSLSSFAEAAYKEFDSVTEQTAAVLFLSRPHRGGGAPDVALTLRHLARLLVPAAKADGQILTVEGTDASAPTAAPPASLRLALATGLLGLIKEGEPGGGTCSLKGGLEPVVRFSHQSARACSLGPVVTKIIAADGIRVQEEGGELTLVFPQSE